MIAPPKEPQIPRTIFENLVIFLVRFFDVVAANTNFFSLKDTKPLWCRSFAMLSPRTWSEGLVITSIILGFIQFSPLQYFRQIGPDWAVNPCILCALICGAVFWAQSKLTIHHELQKSGTKSSDDGFRPKEFKSFQNKWLRVYLVTMLADWLQGTHMYTLYTSYQQPAGALFAIGFSSSAVFGTFLGLFVDKYGRRLGCIVFCLLELVINGLEVLPPATQAYNQPPLFRITKTGLTQNLNIQTLHPSEALIRDSLQNNHKLCAHMIARTACMIIVKKP